MPPDRSPDVARAPVVQEPGPCREPATDPGQRCRPPLVTMGGALGDTVREAGTKIVQQEIGPG